MLNLQRLTIEYFVEELKKAYTDMYSDMEPEYLNIIAWTGRLALENISNTDALYHNVEHTVMVTLAGQAILEGKHIYEGGVSPRDWMHYIIACLCHDIGYVKGVCKLDTREAFATGNGDQVKDISQGETDIALTPYHVDRSKLFVQERFSHLVRGGDKKLIDVDMITSYIELTRFPPPDDEVHKDTRSFAGLVRAADFIGQLGDPDYGRKTPALFYEFEQIDVNKDFGYKNPGDLRESYAKFYWDVVRPYIQDALDYLRVTHDGKQWIANLHSQVFASEHEEVKS